MLGLARKIAEGDLGHERLWKRGNDEAAELAKAIDRMAEALLANPVIETYSVELAGE